ncbi:MAG: trypsin-like peptidase domain-containing protein [Alkalinema sp. RU_4_3]|nr:trypsin-like peptidase domain-containing protein [Alkalinema sp. RU_4_3]
MLSLSNGDRKQLREAIESAYPSPSDLKLFVSESLNQNLALISTEPSHQIVIFDLIKWAIAKGWIDDLVLALNNDTENPHIQQFCGRVLAERLWLDKGDRPLLSTALQTELADWDLEISSAELQNFLPRRFSFEADVGTLQRGLALANAVCKVTFADRSPKESGTGVLIAEDLVLTNYHVLSHETGADLNAIAAMMRFEFGYVSPKFGERPRTQVLKAAGQQAIVASSPIKELDYALVRLQLEDDWAIEPVVLNPSEELRPHDAINLLQHPEGEQMKVSGCHNGIVKTNPAKGLILYVNPAECGSSGSPCFDQDWRLVALHHAGLATSFGSVREGILFSAIYRQISPFL